MIGSEFFPERCVSGLRPGKDIHLGFYFGTISKIVEAQSLYPGENFLIVSDLLISKQATTVKREKTLQLVKGCIALGVDPKKTHIFLQSDIPEIPYMMLKIADRISSEVDSLNGFVFETLMAADVMGLKGTSILVGKDLHNEVDRCAFYANKLNVQLGYPAFPIPKRKITDVDHSEILGTDRKKMSHSNRNYLPIFGSEIEISTAVRRINLPSVIERTRNKDQLLNTLVTEIGSLLAEKSEVDLAKEQFLNAEITDHEFHMKLTSWIIGYFAKHRERFEELAGEDREIDNILDNGRIRAREQYRETLLSVF